MYEVRATADLLWLLCMRHHGHAHQAGNLRRQALSPSYLENLGRGIQKSGYSIVLLAQTVNWSTQHALPLWQVSGFTTPAVHDTACFAGNLPCEACLGHAILWRPALQC